MKPAFGIFDYSMIPKIKRLLKPYGLDLNVKSDRRNWGDRVEVSVAAVNRKTIEAAIRQAVTEVTRSMIDTGQVPFNDERELWIKEAARLAGGKECKD